jgi:hypothetical protein
LPSFRPDRRFRRAARLAVERDLVEDLQRAGIERLGDRRLCAAAG